jgi:hypothetical protein
MDKKVGDYVWGNYEEFVGKIQDGSFTVGSGNESDSEASDFDAPPPLPSDWKRSSPA